MTSNEKENYDLSTHHLLDLTIQIISENLKNNCLENTGSKKKHKENLFWINFTKLYLKQVL